MTRKFLSTAVAMLVACFSTSAQAPEASAPGPAHNVVVVPPGTPLSLILHQSISTRTAKTGELIACETTFPVVVAGRVAIPAGSFVQGEVIRVKRPGRFGRRAELVMSLKRLILPNGYTVSLESRTMNSSTDAEELVTKNGKVSRTSSPGDAAVTVVMGTAVGFMMGTALTLGASGKAMAIGAGLGAGFSLLAVLAERGRDVELPRGATLEFVLQEPLELDGARAVFDDAGRASALPRPSERRIEPRYPLRPWVWPWP